MYNWSGVWQLYAFHDLNMPNEVWEFRRVMAAERGGVTGDFTKTHRLTYEEGGINIWRGGPDLLDPKYVFKKEKK